jgi:diguanylate cyclase (GGDEF)-like protein
MAVILGIYEIRITKMTRRMRLNTICMILILATTLLELVLFKIFQRSNVYGMIGFTIYVVVMSIEMVKDSRKTMERAREAELYHRLAYTDALTGVYNRMAFHQDVENFQSDKESKKAYTVFMLDLNDLKKCNDNFGHENGDKYIKLVSDILVKVFGIDGRCYRIGGDEFCVFMQNADKGDINGKLSSLTRYVEEENKKGFVIRIGVAVGYAVYDEKRDKNLQDTVKRADELMYQNKANIKSKI